MGSGLAGCRLGRQCDFGWSEYYPRFEPRAYQGYATCVNGDEWQKANQNRRSIRRLRDGSFSNALLFTVKKRCLKLDDESRSNLVQSGSNKTSVALFRALKRLSVPPNFNQLRLQGLVTAEAAGLSPLRSLHFTSIRFDFI